MYQLIPAIPCRVFRLKRRRGLDVENAGTGNSGQLSAGRRTTFGFLVEFRSFGECGSYISVYGPFGGDVSVF